MNSAAFVDSQITNWKTMGLSKKEIVVKTAEACMGWPYIWGAYGQECTVPVREKFMNGSSIGEGDRELIRKRCQVLNGSKSSCDGCKYFPGGARTRVFDCRGFTRWVLGWVGINLQGAGATSQWNTAANWSEKGLIADMPENCVCCVFKQVNGKTMDHTGLYVGGGNIIHCSGEVKRGKVTDKGWTHYAIPKGLEGSEPVPDTKPTLRRGSSGEYVTLAQAKLIQLGYDLGKWGADGKFGAATENAVRQFQRDHQLTADGVIGKATWDALENGKAVTYTITVRNLTRSTAEEIKTKYGGEISEEA